MVEPGTDMTRFYGHSDFPCSLWAGGVFNATVHFTDSGASCEGLG